MFDSSEIDSTNEVGEISVVVVAAGQSTRMEGVDKLTLSVGDRPVIGYSLKVFDECLLVRDVVVVAHPTRVDEFQDWIHQVGYINPLRVVAGGRRRQDSVRKGIEALRETSDPAEFVAIHDAARPFIDKGFLERGLKVAKQVGVAIPIVPMKDTIKRVEHGLVVETPDRGGLFSVQTPQIFRAEILRTAHEIVSRDVTDDASMVEIAGGLVGVFEGSSENIKITTQSDIPFANAIASGQTQTPAYRFGVGFDGHELVDGGPLRLGGIDVDFDLRLKGHSDGDVLLHAVSSAILGAAGLGDMGTNFPSSDPRYAGVDSIEFVKIATAKTADLGWRVDHLDATVIAQRPRLAVYAGSFEGEIADAVGVTIDQVNVKITSTDGVGAIGKGEGIAAQAIATLAR